MQSGLMQSLSSYSFMPQEVSFETQDPGEVIILLLRRHLITNLPWIILGTILIIIPLFIFPIIITNISLAIIPLQFITFLILGWYLLTSSYILVNFILWYFNVSIVTNERVIDIDFINLLNKKFAETRIARIEDVTMRTGGFIRSFFDYGDVLVQTAAHEQVFQFYAVPHPDKVVRIINELMERVEENPPA